MDKTEIKKLLYKQKPTAQLSFIDSKKIMYQAKVTAANDQPAVNVFFEIPLADIGDASFTPEQPAQLLIRWLIV